MQTFGQLNFATRIMHIKKDVNPEGTAQLVRMQVRAEYTWHKYNVIDVTGAGKNTPNQDSPLVFMELGEKNPGTLQQFICLPLSAFNQRVVPATKADKFWEDEKVIEA